MCPVLSGVRSCMTAGLAGRPAATVASPGPPWARQRLLEYLGRAESCPGRFRSDDDERAIRRALTDSWVTVV